MQHPSRATRLTIVGAAALLVVTGLTACGSTPSGELNYSGPEPDALVNAASLGTLTFEVDATLEREVTDLTMTDNGKPVAPTERTTQRLAWEPGDLADGEHTVAVEQPSGDGEQPELLHAWSFAVDATPPEVTITSPTTAVVAGEPVTVTGTTEAGATVTVAGATTVAGGDGAFSLTIEEGADALGDLTATDAAGNAGSVPLQLLTVPSRVEIGQIHAVHVTQYAWAYAPLRDNVLQMIDDGKIDAVQLDLKDEDGNVGYDSQVPLAQDSGAAQGVYRLADAVADLHQRGVPIIGRIVAFRDGKVGQWALDHGHLDWLIQTADGQPYTGRYSCCFTSFGNPEVIDYNLDIAEEAAAAGVDAILWDYIRRPDGPVENLRFPGIGDRSPEQAVADFVAAADERLAPYGVQHGVSVYGISATRPTQIAQDIPLMAPYVDFVSPMVYPSHWGPGEYDLPDPNSAPFDIVSRSLADFQKAVAGTRARVVPWLEDTAYRSPDRTTKVREQQRGAAADGIDEWMMWDPNVRYTPGAYAPLP